MERNYTKQELGAKKIIDLKIILRNRGLKISGTKADLIDRILADQSELSQSTSFPLLNLPKDLQKESLLSLEYNEIVNLCKTNKESYKICNDERFWKLYAENRGLVKEPNDTWKQTAILDYLGKYDHDILNEINWDISTIPKNTPGQNRPDIEKMRHSKYPFTNLNPPKYPGIAIITVDEEGEVVPLVSKDFKKIIFRNPVVIKAPDYSRIRSEDITDEGEYGEEYITFIMYPNTPVGITLGYLLEEIYRHIFGFGADEPLSSIEQFSVNPNFYISHSAWEDLEPIDREDGRELVDYDYYELVLGS